MAGCWHTLRQLALTIAVGVAMSSALAHDAHHHDEKPSLVRATGGDFTLASARGPVSLTDFKGKVVAIYFGYTHCTDVCPLDLSKLGQALKLLKPEDAAQVQGLFITLDPVRDDAKTMGSYSAAFHPDLIGLSGTDAEIGAVAKAYGIRYRKGKPTANGNYDIEHPSRISVVGRNGTLLKSLSEKLGAAQMATALQASL